MPSEPFTPDQLFARLEALGIAQRTYSHPPVFTVAEAAALRGQLPGGHCKSLFLKDKKAGLWLVVTLEERRIDLKLLAETLGAPRFSFGSAELLHQTLGVRPGSVTPFALINDTAHRVEIVLDQAMLGHDPLTTIRSTTPAPPRSRRPICCALSRGAGIGRASSISTGSRPPPRAERRRATKTAAAMRQQRLSSRAATAMFCSASPGRLPHGE